MNTANQLEYMNPEPGSRFLLIAGIVGMTILTILIILWVQYRLPIWLDSDLPREILLSRLRTLFHLLGAFSLLPSVFSIMYGIRIIAHGQAPLSGRFLARPVPVRRGKAVRKEGIGLIAFGILFLIMAIMMGIIAPLVMTGAVFS